MLGELGFQGTMTGKSGTNHKFDLQVEVANLSIYMCCMPRSANIKSCVIPSSPPWRFWNSEAFCHWTAGSLQWPGEHGNERHASNVEMDDKVRWELRMLCYDFVVLAIWSTWISVHFLPRIFPSFGSWHSLVAVEGERFKKWLIPRSPSMQPKNSPSSMAHSGWFLVTSRWTQKVVEYGNLPKVPSIQPGKKEIKYYKT